MNHWLKRDQNSPFVSLTLAERALVLTFLVSAAMAGLYAAIFNNHSNHLILWIAFTAYTITLTLPFTLNRFRPAIFHPIVFYVLWTGVRGLLEGHIALAISGLPFHHALAGLTSSELNHIAAKAFFLDTLALLSLYFGFGLSPRFRVPKLPPPSTQAIPIKAIVWVSLSAFAVFVLSQYAGGITNLLMQRGLPGEERVAAQIGGHWNWLAGIGATVPLVWLICDHNALKRPTFWVILLAALAFNFAATGSRGGTIMPLVMLGGIWVLQNRKIPYRIVFLGLVCALLLAGGLGEFRSATMKSSGFDEVQVRSGPLDWVAKAGNELQRLNGPNSGKLGVIGRVPNEVHHLYGESYLSLPFIFIPSKLWAGDTPQAAGALNAKRIFNNPSSPNSPGAVGESYWNFSYPGVVLIFMIYGLILNYIGRLWVNNQHNPIPTLLLIYTLFSFNPTTSEIYDFFQAIIPAILIAASFSLRVRVNNLIPKKSI